MLLKILFFYNQIKISLLCKFLWIRTPYFTYLLLIPTLFLLKEVAHSLRLSLWCALRLCTTLILSHSWEILTKYGTIFWPRRGKKHHQNLLFSIRGAYFWKKEVRSLISQVFGQGCYARLSFTGQQYLNVIPHELTGYGCMRSFWLRLRVLGIKNVFAKQYFCI